jgi:hypothetical protein
MKMEVVYPLGELLLDKTLEIELVSTKFTNLLKVVDVLCEKSEWLVSRLF